MKDTSYSPKNGNQSNNVEKVVAQHLCNSCGACFSVCTKNAISFRETICGNLFPHVNNNICSNCGLCLKVCPGTKISNELLKENFAEPFAGKALKTFIGKASDEITNARSQSGGIVTALLFSLLRTNKIKGALVVSMEKGNPPRPVIRIAKTEEEIANAQKSKYCPVPLLSMMKEIEAQDIPLALVGLPCHIHGAYNMMETYPCLAEKIRYKIGLICEGIMGYAAMDYIRSKISWNGKEKWLLIYKDKSAGGYPGNIRVNEKNKTYVLRKSLRMSLKDFFIPQRCRICFDKMNIFSDITIGDAWGIKQACSEKGYSVCIARNKAGMELLENGVRENAVTLKEISYSEVLAGQKIDEKKKECEEYMKAWLSENRKLPDYAKQIFSIKGENTANHLFAEKLRYLSSLENFETTQFLLEHIDKKMKGKNIIAGLFPFSKTLEKLRKINKAGNS